MLAVPSSCRTAFLQPPDLCNSLASFLHLLFLASCPEPLHAQSPQCSLKVAPIKVTHRFPGLLEATRVLRLPLLWAPPCDLPGVQHAALALSCVLAGVAAQSPARLSLSPQQREVTGWGRSRGEDRMLPALPWCASTPSHVSPACSALLPRPPLQHQHAPLYPLPRGHLPARVRAEPLRHLPGQHQHRLRRLHQRHSLQK